MVLPERAEAEWRDDWYGWPVYMRPVKWAKRCKNCTWDLTDNDENGCPACGEAMPLGEGTEE